MGRRGTSGMPCAPLASWSWSSWWSASASASLLVLLLFACTTHSIEARTDGAAERRAEGTSAPTPVWPRAFRIAFNEATGLPIIGGKTEGQLYYDANQRAERIDRVNGHIDRYCGSVHPLKWDTPCTHIAYGGERFLLFPELHGDDACCSCCSFEDGCGPLSADWLRNATFVPPGRPSPLHQRRGAGSGGGLRKDAGEEACWKLEGLQENFFCQTLGSRAPLRIVQGSGSTLDDQEFTANSFVEGAVDPAVFDVPDDCRSRKCGGVCRFI